MRLFVALEIEDGIRRSIARFLDGVREFAPDARWVRPESLHVTLKFIGEQSPEEMENIKRMLETITAFGFEMTLSGYGFFPGVRMPRVFWIGVEAGPQLPTLAASVNEKLASIGIPKEEHAFNPHLTLARGGGSSSSAGKGKSTHSRGRFQRLQEKLAALPAPEFGTMTAREFFLYQSQPLPGGSRYTKLANFRLQ
jgi:RNA 2',3'-cyclic 3'-phosphodiesterase